MNWPEHETPSGVPEAAPPPPEPQEHDLRGRGVLAALASCAGTCAALVVWLTCGILQGGVVLAATFVLLVAFLVASSARAARGPAPPR